jgi:hypothetical protein
MPKRIQRKRVKGWRAPAGAVNCTRPGKWGNPFAVADYGLDAALHLFEANISDELKAAARTELRGHDLMCFCALDRPCHVDIWLRIANSEAAR